MCVHVYALCASLMIKCTIRVSPTDHGELFKLKVKELVPTSKQREGIALQRTTVRDKQMRMVYMVYCSLK
jgi:hypothetical protein